MRGKTTRATMTRWIKLVESLYKSDCNVELQLLHQYWPHHYPEECGPTPPPLGPKHKFTLHRTIFDPTSRKSQCFVVTWDIKITTRSALETEFRDQKKWIALAWLNRNHKTGNGFIRATCTNSEISCLQLTLFFERMVELFRTINVSFIDKLTPPWLQIEAHTIIFYPLFFNLCSKFQCLIIDRSTNRMIQQKTVMYSDNLLNSIYQNCVEQWVVPLCAFMVFLPMPDLARGINLDANVPLQLIEKLMDTNKSTLEFIKEIVQGHTYPSKPKTIVHKTLGLLMQGLPHYLCTSHAPMIIKILSSSYIVRTRWSSLIDHLQEITNAATDSQHILLDNNTVIMGHPVTHKSLTVQSALYTVALQWLSTEAMHIILDGIVLLAELPSTRHFRPKRFATSVHKTTDRLGLFLNVVERLTCVPSSVDYTKTVELICSEFAFLDNFTSVFSIDTNQNHSFADRWYIIAPEVEPPNGCFNYLHYINMFPYRI
jgi:hypothetical protein